MTALHIAVLGAGNIGSTLGRKWLAAGHEVVFGVTDPGSPRAEALRGEVGQSAAISGAEQALDGAEVVVLAIPGKAVEELLQANAGRLDGKIIVDATNRMGGGPMNSVAALSGAAPTAHVYRAFNSLGWENFADPVLGGLQADLFYAGPDDPTRPTMERLIGDVGLRPVYVGGPEQVVVVDAVASLWFALALGQRKGRRLAFKMLTP